MYELCVCGGLTVFHNRCVVFCIPTLVSSFSSLCFYWHSVLELGVLSDVRTCVVSE